MRPLSRHRHRSPRLIVRVAFFLAPVLALLLGCAASQLPQHPFSQATGTQAVSLSAASVNTPPPVDPPSALSTGTVAIVVVGAAFVLVVFWRLLLRVLLATVLAVLAYAFIMLGVGLSNLTHDMNAHQAAAPVAVADTRPSPSQAQSMT